MSRFNWAVAVFAIGVTASACSGGAAGGGASQSDASISGTGLIHDVCTKRLDIAGCYAPYVDPYLCKDFDAPDGGPAPAGVRVLSAGQLGMQCTLSGAATPPGQSISCCTDLGSEFAY